MFHGMQIPVSEARPQHTAAQPPKLSRGGETRRSSRVSSQRLPARVPALWGAGTRSVAARRALERVALRRPLHALGRYSAGPPTLKRRRRLGGRVFKFDTMRVQSAGALERRRTPERSLEASAGTRRRGGSPG